MRDAIGVQTPSLLGWGVGGSAALAVLISRAITALDAARAKRDREGHNGEVLSPWPFPKLLAPINPSVLPATS